MQVNVRGKNVEVTEALRDHVTRKIGKIGNHLDHQTIMAEAVLSVEKDRQIVEVTVPVEGRFLRGEESTPDMYASVDLVVDKLERQLDKLKTRMKHRNHVAQAKRATPLEPESQVVRRKTFPIKPMSLDEAILQLEMVGHDFFAFTNADSERINVVYRRKDGNYGLLEPQ